MSENTEVQIPQQEVQVVQNTDDLGSQTVEKGQAPINPIQSLDFEVPRSPAGRIDWKTLQMNPEHLKRYIEVEALKAKNEGIAITFNSLLESGRAGLNDAIRIYYPGGIRELRTNIDDSTIALKRVRGFWDNPIAIEAEARKILEEKGDFRDRILRETGNSSLGFAINRYYQGGMPALRKKLGLDENIPLQEYWNDTTNIEVEAKKIIASKGALTQKTIKDSNTIGLMHAIDTKYPGGLTALKSKFGIESTRPDGYWKDSKNIEKEAREAMDQGVNLTSDNLRDAGLSSLAAAISQNYPDGLPGLKKVLFGIEGPRPNGYWKDPANIEKEARDALLEGITISASALLEARRSSLRSAIKDYPGGMHALKEKLGLNEIQVSPDKADEMMRSLQVE